MGRAIFCPSFNAFGTDQFAHCPSPPPYCANSYGVAKVKRRVIGNDALDGAAFGGLAGADGSHH